VEGGMSLLSLGGVSKHFSAGGSRFAAVQNVSLTVGDGAFVALVGPSGCGKSTLLRLVAGLEAADAGLLSLAGEEIRGPADACGLIFQDHRLLPWLTVEQNVDLALTHANLSRAQRDRVIAAHLELVGLAAFARAFPRELSGGMAQRAAIARGLVNRPRLLLLDEPFSALDSFTRTRLQGELERIWAYEKIAMVLVTHDVEEALYLADRVVVLAANPGRIAHVLDVSLKRPRDRVGEDFVALKAEILRQLDQFAEAA